MRHPFLLALSVLASACGGPDDPWEGSWFYTLDPDRGTFESSLTCEENFRDADCPEAAEAEEGEWTVEVQREAQGEIHQFEVLRGDEGTYFIIINDEPIPGTVNENTLTFSWDMVDNTTETTSHESGDYDWSYTENETTTTTISLTRGEEGGYTGSMATDSTMVFSYSEPDEWPMEDVSVFSGRIDSEAFAWLENAADEEDPDGRVNDAEEENCSSRECTIEVTETTKYVTPFDAWWTEPNASTFLGESGRRDIF